MKPISGKQLARLLEKHGWQLLRIQGSHHIYGKTGRIERLSVPVYGGRPLKMGLLHHLLRLAGLTESDLE